MNETERIIQKTLDLNKKLTTAQEILERYHQGSPIWWNAHGDLCEVRDKFESHAARTNARLALMLETALHFIKENEDKYASECIDKIEQIAKGEVKDV